MLFTCFSCLYSLPSVQGDHSARFNGTGTRLLCSGLDSQLMVYDLPSQQQRVVDGKVLLKAPYFRCVDNIGHNASCFAGLDDELAISGSDNQTVPIWSLLNAVKGQSCTLERPLHVLEGHRNTIRSVRYCKVSSTIVSCDDDGVIKLWTPS